MAKLERKLNCCLKIEEKIQKNKTQDKNLAKFISNHILVSKNRANLVLVLAISFFYDHIMSQSNIESLLGSSQAELLEPQGSIPRKKDEVRRLRMRIGTFKGNLTTETKKFISFIEYYEKKYPQDDETDLIGTTKIDYASGILKSFDRVTDRYVLLENALDELRTLMSDI